MTKLLQSALRVFLLFAAMIIISMLSSVFTVTYLKMDSQGLVPRSLSIGGESGRRDYKAPPQSKKPVPFMRRNQEADYEA